MADDGLGVGAVARRERRVAEHADRLGDELQQPVAHLPVLVRPEAAEALVHRAGREHLALQQVEHQVARRLAHLLPVVAEALDDGRQQAADERAHAVAVVARGGLPDLQGAQRDLVVVVAEQLARHVEKRAELLARHRVVAGVLLCVRVRGGFGVGMSACCHTARALLQLSRPAQQQKRARIRSVGVCRWRRALRGLLQHT